MAIEINGKKVSAARREQIKATVAELKQRTGSVPGLAVILVGDDPASEIYVRNKGKACEAVGFNSSTFKLPTETTQEELHTLIDSLNEDATIHGILCQMPIPDHLNPQMVVDRISPDKDVDGFHPVNAGLLSQGRETFVPCTPAGIMELLREYEIAVSGQHCVIVGRSNLVGKPLAHLMLQADATVTVAHSRTANLPDLCRRADILVAATGRRGLIGADCIRPGAVVIDVGINRDEAGKVTGDVEAAAARRLAAAFTPVPGGVGPMTITMLLENTLIAFKRMMISRERK